MTERQKAPKSVDNQKGPNMVGEDIGGLLPMNVNTIY